MSSFGFFMIGVIVCFLWMVTACLAAFWWHFLRAKEEQAIEDHFNYRPHREGNIVAFRRR